MSILLRPYIETAAYVHSFREPDRKIRYELLQAESAFSTFMGVQAISANVPDQADPNHARIIFQSNKKTLLISQMGCQVQFQFDAFDKSFDMQLQILRKKLSEYFCNVIKFKDFSFFGEQGLVLDINFPSKESILELQRSVYECFMSSLPRLGDVVSAQVNVGYKLGDYFLNLSISTYETRQVNVDPTAGQHQFLKMDSMPLVESGLKVRVDVNNRPVSDGEPKLETANELIELIYGFVANKLIDLLSNNFEVEKS